MIRTGAFIVVGLGLAVPSMAWGQTAAPQSDDKRYTFNRVDEGYLRLDGRTGQVSICAQRPAGMPGRARRACRARDRDCAPSGRKRSGQKRADRTQFAAAWRTVKPDAPAANPDEPRLQLPNDADLNKVMNFVEKVWRRLLDMIATVHKDVLKKQS